MGVVVNAKTVKLPHVFHDGVILAEISALLDGLVQADVAIAQSAMGVMLARL